VWNIGRKDCRGGGSEMNQIDWERTGESQPAGAGWLRPHIEFGQSEVLRGQPEQDQARPATVDSETLADFVCRGVHGWLNMRLQPLTVVSLVPQSLLPRLSEEGDSRVFWAENDAGSALQWALSLVGRKQRVVVLISARQLRQHLDEICGGIGTRLLLIVILTPDDDSEAGGRGLSPNESCLSMLSLLPWKSVMVPADPFDCREMVSLVASAVEPTAILVSARPRLPIAFPDSRTSIQFGRSECLFRGGEVVLAAIGESVAPAVAAARRLTASGQTVSVLNLRFAAPFDHRTLAREVRDAKRLYVIDAGAKPSSVLTPLQGEILRSLRRIGWPTSSRQIVLHGPITPETLESHVDQIVQSVRNSGFVTRDRDLHSSPNQPMKRAGLDSFGFSLSSLRHEHEAVQATVLSPQIEAWYQTYSTVGPRGRYLWQWCQHGAYLTTLPCVREDLVQHVCETKVLSIMLCVLLDDVADEQGRETLLDVLFRIIEPQEGVDLSGLSAPDRRWAKVTRELATTYHERIRECPLYAEYADLLNFDQQQYFNTMRYSSLLNRHLNLLNPTEHDLYLPHAMHMMSFSTLDLMCSPGFPAEDLGRLREALWQLQCMGRVGNLLSTWRREIPQSDFTSGVFARAVVSGDLTVSDLANPSPHFVEDAVVDGRHERHFARRWHSHRHRYIRKARDIRSLDWKKLLEGNERFFRMHLGSRGLI